MISKTKLLNFLIIYLFFHGNNLTERFLYIVSLFLQYATELTLQEQEQKQEQEHNKNRNRTVLEQNRT